MRVFFDVDTQNDFMQRGMGLYVPNSERILPVLERITNHALREGIPIYGSVDAHARNSAEFGRFPPHCISGTYGQMKITETQYQNTLFVPDRVYTNKELDEIVLRVKQGLVHGVYFEKDNNDVSKTINFRWLLEKQNVTEAVVYGVATEYCLKDAVMGLQELGIQVYLIEDAIAAVDEAAGRSALEAMAGAKHIKAMEVLR